MPIKKLLIANRGEIAIRIARAAATLGIETVAIYAPVDQFSLHARQASERILLDATDDPVTAYLDIESIIRIAKESGCDAIHPGYGFLSENADFARACEKAGIAFVGPDSACLELFGDKLKALELARSLDIPTVPGCPVTCPEDAAAFAGEHGFPVMIKAAMGGGGRGMRAVFGADDLPEAIVRAASEAKSAFGNDALFIERLVPRPKHIEVQVLADNSGKVVHLYERDCSIQQRNQKVVEIAPAPELDKSVKEQLHDAAVRLISAAKYQNAATVEFLVAPESGAFFFIECNPRIQVEHTITEEVLGIELVEAQLQIAMGASLESLGLVDLPPPRSFAIQSRVVLHGSGLLQGYKEPAGAGIRVDGIGYAGYTPPPQFDPLLAKLICRAESYERALRKTQFALGEFNIQGAATNLGQLKAIVGHPVVVRGDARTTFLAEEAETLSPSKALSASLELLQQQTRALGPRSAPPIVTASQTLSLASGDVGVECPMSGSIIEIAVEVGDTVNAGDTLLVVSAMKTETTLTAPCTGTVSAVAIAGVEAQVHAGDTVIAITPDADGDTSVAVDHDDSWLPMIEQADRLRDIAAKRLAPGSTDPGVVRQRERGKLTCRERIELFLDSGTFHEIGSASGFTSYDGDTIAEFTPSNHVGGWGKCEERTVVVCADDFTSRGGHADGTVKGKNLYFDQLSLEMRVPEVRMLDGSSGGGSVASMIPQQETRDGGAKESTGAIRSGQPRVAGAGGSSLSAHLGGHLFNRHLNTVPVVNLLLGSVVGIGAAKAMLGHFSVMVKDMSQLFVAGPPVVRQAMGYNIDRHDLGGWQIHCTNGSVDNLAETELDAMTQTRRFLSYLPSSVYELPPVIDPTDSADRAEEELLTIIPRNRASSFDIRKLIRLVADQDSFFEIGPLWGTDQITGFVRMNGYPMGVIASDSRHESGGALTADGCDKLTRLLDICDQFHLPLLNLVDNPGFAVGLENEIHGTIRKGATWMMAFTQINIPIFTVLLRRAFGVAGLYWATPQNRVSMRVTWPALDSGSLPPESGIEAAYRRQLAESDDPDAMKAELMTRIESRRGPIGPMTRFEVEELIDPRETRQRVCDWIPEAYRTLNHSDRLGPRTVQFRP